MAKIYRTTDRIPVKVGELMIKISPLTRHQKADIQKCIMQGQILEATARSVQYSVKDVDGLQNQDGSKYELSFDESGKLSDDCVDDLFNMPESEKLSRVCLHLLQSVPDQFLDVETGEKIDGVDFIKQEKPSRKKS